MKPATQDINELSNRHVAGYKIPVAKENVNKIKRC